ncbi:MAG: DnaB-like helicase N-terminal domain-containing protein, partial [Ignavibacteria bacterium]|nr:DnaB-like helicase N-terminal domain-containing protein [Ignavibacteria bacterium]
MQIDTLVVDFEKALEGAVFINPDCFMELVDVVKSSYFSINRNQWIWEAFESLSERDIPIDHLTVCDELNSKGRLEEIGGSGYLIDLVNWCPTSLNAMAYGEQVRKK